MKLFCGISILCLLWLSSCNNTGTKELDYKAFTIRVPQNWKRVDVKGIDSFVGRIDIDSATSVGFDMGWYCSKLDKGRYTTYYSIEGDNVYTPDSSIKQNLKEPSAWKYYGKADSTNLEKLRRNRVTWITIDGYKAKLVTPKIPGLGTTGVYIDSLWKADDYNNGFVLSGYNLTSVQQEQLVAAIKTIKFNRPTVK